MVSRWSTCVILHSPYYDIDHLDASNVYATRTVCHCHSPLRGNAITVNLEIDSRIRRCLWIGQRKSRVVSHSMARQADRSRSRTHLPGLVLWFPRNTYQARDLSTCLFLGCQCTVLTWNKIIACFSSFLSCDQRNPDLFSSGSFNQVALRVFSRRADCGILQRLSHNINLTLEINISRNLCWSAVSYIYTWVRLFLLKTLLMWNSVRIRLHLLTRLRASCLSSFVYPFFWFSLSIFKPSLRSERSYERLVPRMPANASHLILDYHY